MRYSSPFVMRTPALWGLLPGSGPRPSDSKLQSPPRAAGTGMKGREKLVASLPEGVSVAPRLLLSAMEDDDFTSAAKATGAKGMSPRPATPRETTQARAQGCPRGRTKGRGQRTSGQGSRGCTTGHVLTDAKGAEEKVGSGWCQMLLDPSSKAFSVLCSPPASSQLAMHPLFTAPC